MSQAPALLLKDADLVATFNGSEQSELKHHDVLIQDRRIAAIFPSADRPQLPAGTEVINVQGCVITPGLVNTHHHMFQSMTRAVPGAQNAELFNWLQALYPIWQTFRPEHFKSAVAVAMAELLLSGCTTSSDHQYLFPNGATLDDSIEVALTLGLRFHASRGSMSVGVSQGGLPPDSLVENEPAILKDTQSVIERWHDSTDLAMTRVVVAPCSPFSVSNDLMIESARLARATGTRLHTHLAENDKDLAYSLERFGQTPAQYAESLDWVGEDVWHAHCVKLDEQGQYLFANTRTGIAHCPCSNMRLASGILPLPAMLKKGVRIGLGVDGSASNDGADMLGEARQALLLARVGHGPDALTAREALNLATRGGAQVLGRRDIGHLAVGMAADLAVWDVRQIEYAGAQHDLLAALVFCAPRRTKHTVVNGRVIVKDGQLCTADLPIIIETQAKLARALLSGSC
jgi:8-oxoguanine deaminase